MTSNRERLYKQDTKSLKGKLKEKNSKFDIKMKNLSYQNIP